MQKVCLRKINFGSFIKLFSTVAALTGLGFGLILFILSLFGGNVYAKIGTTTYHGIIAGILNIFIMPILFFIFSFLVSLITYWPFKLFLMKYKKFDLYGEFEIYQVQEHLLSESDSASSVVSTDIVNETDEEDSNSVVRETE